MAELFARHLVEIERQHMLYRDPEERASKVGERLDG